MPRISSVTVASFAGVGAANPAGRTNLATTSARPNSNALFFISTTSGADYTTGVLRGIYSWRATTEAVTRTPTDGPSFCGGRGRRLAASGPPSSKSQSIKAANGKTNGGSAAGQQRLRDSGVDKRFQVMDKRRFAVGLNPGQFHKPRLSEGQRARPGQVFSENLVDER